MKPIVLSNAFLRPKATCLLDGIQYSETSRVYACIDEIIRVITGPLDASPLLLPTRFDPAAACLILEHVDGIILPGAVSNLHPSHYGEQPIEDPQIFDADHDATDMFLIAEARRRKIPFLGICRSMQAMNLVFGGSLHQQLKTENINHQCSVPAEGTIREPQYRHRIEILNGSQLSQITPHAIQEINSMHEQGIKKLGVGLQKEAVAEDGVIEAISWPAADVFFMGFQWHPETIPEHPLSLGIFNSFKQSISKHFIKRTRLMINASP